MFKIFYAISDSFYSSYFLKQFLKYSKYNVKVAAYHHSHDHMDFNLSSLRSVKYPGKLLSYHDNNHALLDAINKFNPDLIISDFEKSINDNIPYLKAPVWQVSDNMMYYALSAKDKSSISLFTKFPKLFNIKQKIVNIIYGYFNSSSKNYVISHFADLEPSLTLNDKFNWIRPYNNIGKKFDSCSHDIVAVSDSLSPMLLKYLSKYKDSVYYYNCQESKYNNLIAKNIYNEELICNLVNSKVIISHGPTSILASLFYNNIYSYILPDIRSQISIINAYVSEKYKLGKIIHGYEKEIPRLTENPPAAIFNKSCRYLHEEIDFQFGLR